MARYLPRVCTKCGKTYDRNRQAKECPHGTPHADFDKDIEPRHDYVSSETAYGRTVGYDFAIKVF